MNNNKILKRITYDIYKSRPPMPVKMRTNYRIERVNGGLLCDLWFLTVGCMHDAGGGCVMCNYGKNSGCVEWNRILQELQNVVTKLPWKFEDFLLTSSGSLLDEREVTAAMRDDLTALLKSVRTKRFIVETRADTITDSGLEFVKNAMPQAETYIEIGVESSDDWVLKYCVNKGTDFERFKQAAKRIHQKGMLVTANIGLGFPFMSERAAVNHTVRSIRDARKAGADSVVLFPYHVKRGTLLDVMYRNQMYQCVSLWALAEVLENFSEEELKYIQISWYKDYFGEQQSYIYRSPQTCPECRKDVMAQLDRYRDSQAYSDVRELSEISCHCREEWKRQIKMQAADIQIERVKEDYRKLAGIYKIDRDALEEGLSHMEQEFMRR